MSSPSPWYPSPKFKEYSTRRKSEDLPHNLTLSALPRTLSASEDHESSTVVPSKVSTSNLVITRDRRHKRRSATLSYIPPPENFEWVVEPRDSEQSTSSTSSNLSHSNYNSQSPQGFNIQQIRENDALKKKSTKDKLVSLLFPSPDLMIAPNPYPVVPREIVERRKSASLSRPNSEDWTRVSLERLMAPLPNTPAPALARTSTIGNGPRSSTFLNMFPGFGNNSNPELQSTASTSQTTASGYVEPTLASLMMASPPPVPGQELVAEFVTAERARKPSAGFGFLKRVRSFRVDRDRDREREIESNAFVPEKTATVEEESETLREEVVEDQVKVLSKKKSGLGLNIHLFGKSKVIPTAEPEPITFSSALPPLPPLVLLDSQPMTDSPTETPQLFNNNNQSIMTGMNSADNSQSQLLTETPTLQYLPLKKNSIDLMVRSDSPETVLPKSSKRKSLSLLSSFSNPLSSSTPPKEEGSRPPHPLSMFTHTPFSSPSPRRNSGSTDSRPKSTIVVEEGRKRRSNSVVLLSEFGSMSNSVTNEQRDMTSLFDRKSKSRKGSRANSPSTTSRQMTNNGSSSSSGFANIVGSIMGFKGASQSNSSLTSLQENIAIDSSNPTSEILQYQLPPRPSISRRPSTAGGEARSRSRGGLSSPFGPFAAIRNSVLFSPKDAPMFPRPVEVVDKDKNKSSDHLAVPTTPTTANTTDIGFATSNTPIERSSSSSDSLSQSRLNPLSEIRKKRSTSPIQLKRKGSQKSRPSTSSISDPSRPPTSKPQAPIPIEPDETPIAYINRLQLKANKMDIASILSSSADPYHLEALQTYMNLFDFSNLPLDIAIRKLLFESRLPRETQQIDRVMETFSKSYVGANPALFGSADQAYILAFSLIMLHTDAFNKNNKNKMTKADYVRNLSKSVDGLGKDVLEYFFDNITATPFVYGEDDDTELTGELTVNTPTVATHSLFNAPNVNPNTKEKVPKITDLYNMIANEPLLLNDLRADVQAFIPPKNPYSYTGTSPFFNVSDLHVAFSRPFILPIALSQHESIPLNLGDYIQPDLNVIGTVSNLKVAKAGILTRKEDLIEGGRKSSSRKWKTWGVILTGSQLLFFKDISWVDGVVKQVKASDVNTNDVEFATVTGLSPDEVISLENSLALYDSSYERHPYAFRLLVQNGRQFLLQASGTKEMNDWLAFINYAATFKTLGVRMRDDSQLGLLSAETFRRPKLSVSSSSDSSGSPALEPFRSFSQNSLMDFTVEPSSVLSNSTSVYSDLAAVPSAIPSEWGPKLITRTDVLRKKISELDDRVEVVQSGLQIDLRQVRNLDILMPLLKTTRDKIKATLPALERKVRSGRIELSKVHCYREVLVRDILAEERDFHKHRFHRRTPSQTKPSSRRTSSATYYSLKSSALDSPPRAPYVSQDEENYASDDENERRRLSITPVLNLKRRNTGDVFSAPHSQRSSKLSVTVSSPLAPSNTLRPRAHSHDLPPVNSLGDAIQLYPHFASVSSDGLVPSKQKPVSPTSSPAQSTFADQEINARKLSKIREERRSEILRAGFEDVQ